MNIKEFEKIEAFLKNNLEPQEREYFLVELQKNKILAESLEFQRQLYFGLEALSIEKKLNVVKLKFEENQIKEEEIIISKQKNIFFTKKWIAAAGISLIFGFSLFYKQQYYISPDVKNLVSQEISYKSLPIRYPQGSNENLKNELNQQKAQYFLALAYLQSGEKRKAKNILNIIIKDKNNIYFQKSFALLNKI